MDPVVACHTCGLAQHLPPVGPGMRAACDRCGATIAMRHVHGAARTAAFSLAALMFYVPANIYPILRMDIYGIHSENTIWDGCVALFRQGEVLIAVIVFFASILIPFVKLLGLFFLVATVRLRSRRQPAARTWLYRVLEAIGPWSMLDVFLLSILVALVRLGEVATVLPGRGLFAFTAVVVLTILASASFDPTLLWEPDRPS